VLSPAVKQAETSDVGGADIPGMFKYLGTLLLSVCLLAMPWHDARSQDVDDEVVVILEDFDDGELAEAFQIFSIIGVAPGISGARFEVDGDDGDSDVEIRSFKIPIKRDWKAGAFCFVASDDQRSVGYELRSLAKTRSESALCARPYMELTLGYLNADQGVLFDEDEAGLEDATIFNLDITTLSALAGFGLSFPITEKTVFRPILLGGYSHIDNDTNVVGNDADEFNDALDGSLVDGELDSILIGGAAELQHERVLGNNIELTGNLRYNHLVSSAFNASDDALEGTNDFIVITGGLEASIPTGLALFSRDLHALGFGGTNILLDGFGDLISGDDFIHEVGGGLEVKEPWFVQGIRLRGSVLFGEDVFGWRAGLGIKF